MTSVRADLCNPREIEAALRDVMGLSQRQAKRFMSGGYSAMVSERDVADQGEIEAIKTLIHTLKGNKP